MASRTAATITAERIECWCCGQPQTDQSVVRLGNHPEVVVCFRCAHFLHQQARQREDEQSPSVASRLRDVFRAARQFVMRRNLHRLPILGGLLRRLNKWMP